MRFRFLIYGLFLLFPMPDFAQIFYNNGADVFFSQGSVAIVNGNTENAAGIFTNNGEIRLNGDFTLGDTVQGYGTYRLTGDWINNAVFLYDTSLVVLEGDTQHITGNNSTYFYNLELDGTGIKYLTINTFVSNMLNLNHIELATDSFLLTLLNTDTSAIQRTTGFVSSLQNGYLIRYTHDTLPYLFPTGSSVPPQRYRPVTIKPLSQDSAQFAVRFVNHDASTDGYNRNIIDTTLCSTEPDYYFMITRFAGNTSAQLGLFYDESNDGFWNEVANWQTNQWIKLNGTVLTTNTPFNTLTTGVISNFINQPYLPAVSQPEINLGNDTAFCSGSSIVLDAGANFDTYQWSTGDTTQTIIVNTAGIYSVTATINGCTASGTIKVSEHELNYTLYGDTSICQGDSATLNVSTDASFYWSTGDTDSTTTVTPSNTTTYTITIQDSVCSLSDSITVNVAPTVNADAGQDVYICQGDTTVLTASGGTNYVWNTGESTSSITVSPTDTTTYYVTVTNDSGCEGTDSVTVYVLPPPEANAGNDTSVCEGTTLQLHATGGTDYHWEPSSLLNNPDLQNPTTTITATTTFIVTVSNGACYDTDSITVSVLPAPNLQVDDDTSICHGDSISIAAYGNGSFQWSTGDTIAQITVSPATTNTYSVTLTSTNGCSSTGNITVTVVPLPEAFAGNDTSICQGETAWLHAEGGSSYYWTPQIGVDNPYSQNTTAHPQTTTTYTVIVSNGNCSDIDSVTVIVNTLPYIFAGNDTSIEEGTHLQLQAITNANTPSFLWTPDLYLSQNNIANPVTTPSNTITYIVNVTDANGCSNSDTITVFVTEQPENQLIIYNTFTPNHDGVNDTWHIEGIEMYPDNYLVIYNRDGMKVYEKHGYANEWDGKYYGNDLPAATYYYILDLGNGSTPLKGHVTIIR